MELRVLVRFAALLFACCVAGAELYDSSALTVLTNCSVCLRGIASMFKLTRHTENMYRRSHLRVELHGAGRLLSMHR